MDSQVTQQIVPTPTRLEDPTHTPPPDSPSPPPPLVALADDTAAILPAPPIVAFIHLLPEEIVLDIFELAVKKVSYRERKSTLRSLALVRKDWTRPAQRILWSYLVFQGKGGLERDRDDTARVRMFCSSRVTLDNEMRMRTTKLQLMALASTDAEEIISACRGLRELQIQSVSGFNSKILTIPTLADLKSLMILETSDNSVLPEDDANVSVPFKLDYLILDTIHFPFAILSADVASATSTSLCLSDVNMVSDEQAYNTLVQLAPHWTSLSLLNCDLNGTLGRILSRCSNLADLSIEGDEISYLDQLPASLEVLEFRTRPRYKDLMVLFGDRGPSCVKNLKKLELDWVEPEDEEELLSADTISSGEGTKFKSLCDERKILLRLDD